MCWVWPHRPGPCLAPPSTHQRAAGWRTGPRFPTGLLAPLSSFLLSSLAAAGSLLGGAQGTGCTAGSAALLSLPLLGRGLVWSLFPPAPSSSIFPCSFLPLGPVLSPLFQLVAPPSARPPSLSFSALACLAASAWEPVPFTSILVMILLPSYSISPPVSARLSSHLSLCLPSLSVVLPPLLCLSPLSLPAIQSPGCAVIPFCSPVLLPA